MARPRQGTRRWTNVRGAAEYSGYSTRTIRQRIADGDLPAYMARGSRVLRVDLNDVDAMIENVGRIPTGHLPVNIISKRGGDTPAARRSRQ